MTAVAALGVYRAYKHTMHDRVMTYLRLRDVDEEAEYSYVIDDDIEDRQGLEPARAALDDDGVRLARPAVKLHATEAHSTG